jgi:hypothetical protein
MLVRAPHRGRYHTDRQPGAALQNTAMCPAGPPGMRGQRAETLKFGNPSLKRRQSHALTLALAPGGGEVRELTPA